MGGEEVGGEIVERPEVLNALVAQFGEDLVDRHGRLNRRLLGQRAFADRASNTRLNQIVWPSLSQRVKARVREGLCESPDRPVVVDAALLVEWGDLGWLDALIVVTADRAIRKARMMHRMGLSEQEVESRMEAQLPEEEKIQRADYVIENNRAERDLIARASEVWADLMAGTGNRPPRFDQGER